MPLLLWNVPRPSPAPELEIALNVPSSLDIGYSQHYVNYYLSSIPFSLVHSQLDSTIIDPAYIGNVGRFANHSCSPNCCLRIVHVNTSVAHVALFARRPLASLEEITFDYGDGEDNDDDDGVCEQEDQTADGATKLGQSAERQKHYAQTAEAAGEDRTICLCASKHCRGYLPFDEALLDKSLK